MSHDMPAHEIAKWIIETWGAIKPEKVMHITAGEVVHLAEAVLSPYKYVEVPEPTEPGIWLVKDSLNDKEWRPIVIYKLPFALTFAKGWAAMGVFADDAVFTGPITVPEVE